MRVRPQNGEAPQQTPYSIDRARACHSKSVPLFFQLGRPFFKFASKETHSNCAPRDTTPNQLGMQAQLSERAPSARLEPAPQGLGAPKAKAETLFCTQTTSPFGNALSVSRTFGPRAISANGFAVWKRFVSFSDLRPSSNISKRLRHFLGPSVLESASNS